MQAGGPQEASPGLERRGRSRSRGGCRGRSSRITAPKHDETCCTGSCVASLQKPSNYCNSVTEGEPAEGAVADFVHRAVVHCAVC